MPVSSQGRGGLPLVQRGWLFPMGVSYGSIEEKLPEGLCQFLLLWSPSSRGV